MTDKPKNLLFMLFLMHTCTFYSVSRVVCLSALACNHSVGNYYPRTINNSSSNTQKFAGGNRVLLAVLSWRCLLSPGALLLFQYLKIIKTCERKEIFLLWILSFFFFFPSKSLIGIDFSFFQLLEGTIYCSMSWMISADLPSRKLSCSRYGVSNVSDLGPLSIL